MNLLVYAICTLTVMAGLNGLKCELGTYHKVRKDGREKCKKCSLCNAGQGLNTSVMVKTDAIFGFMECYSCERCPVGYYRQAKSVSQTCYECRLDCKRLNRYGSVQCGYDTPGHCGECIHGFRPESSEPNDICRKQVKLSMTTLHDNVFTYEREASRQQSQQTLDTAQVVLLIFGVALAVMAIVTLIISVRSRREAQVPSSDEDLLSAYESTPFSKPDLDTDGPTPVPARLDLQFSDENDVKLTATRRTYPDRIIDMNDVTLSIISKHISGKTVQVFFNCLHIHKSKIEPHEELWEKHKISYPNYILDVLIEWTKSAQPKPTLALLCEALQKAAFSDVIDDILVLAENQPI